MVRSSGAFIAAAIVVTTFTATAQGPAPDIARRIDAFVAAIQSLDADRFETMAQEHFAPPLLARRSAADRRGMIGQLRTDFGTLSVQGVEVTPDLRAFIRVRGSSGIAGRIDLSVEPQAPHRITGLGIDIGGPDAEDEGPMPPVSGTMTPDQLRGALQPFLNELATSGTFSGMVLIARDGHTVFEQSIGQADRRRGLANNPATRFNIGSINKIFTRLAIGQLVANKRLRLTDTLGTVLPDYPNTDARGATIEQLLTHQGGISDFFGPRFAATPKSQFRSNADYFRFVAPQPLLFAPGTRRQYCNGCYVVLGEIVATLAGTTYEKYVIDHIFTPAGMNSSGFFQADQLPDNVARGYTREGAVEGQASARAEVDNSPMHGAAGSAAGGAYATAADLLRFDNALREGRLANRETTAWVVNSEPAAPGQRAGGLGIAGGAPGLNATLESEGRWTVVVLANLDPPAAERLGAAIHRQLSR